MTINNHQEVLGARQPVTVKIISFSITFIFCFLIGTVFLIKSITLSSLSAILIICLFVWYNYYRTINVVNLLIEHDSILIEHALKGNIIKPIDSFKEIKGGFWKFTIYFKDGDRFNFFPESKFMKHLFLGTEKEYIAYLTQKIISQQGYSSYNTTSK